MPTWAAGTGRPPEAPRLVGHRLDRHEAARLGLARIRSRSAARVSCRGGAGWSAGEGRGHGRTWGQARQARSPAFSAASRRLASTGGKSETWVTWVPVDQGVPPPPRRKRGTTTTAPPRRAGRPGSCRARVTWKERASNGPAQISGPGARGRGRAIAVEVCRPATFAWAQDPRRRGTTSTAAVEITAEGPRRARPRGGRAEARAPASCKRVARRGKARGGRLASWLAVAGTALAASQSPTSGRLAASHHQHEPAGARLHHPLHPRRAVSRQLIG